MKNYTITVNGTTYDVTVEEKGNTAGTPVRNSTPAAQPSSPAPAAPAASGSEGKIKVTAPMPGKVLSITAEAGQAVKKGDTI